MDTVIAKYGGAWANLRGTVHLSFPLVLPHGWEMAKKAVRQLSTSVQELEAWPVQILASPACQVIHASHFTWAMALAKHYAAIPGEVSAHTCHAAP